MIKDGINDRQRYALASLLVCTMDTRRIGGVALGSDGERELKLLVPYMRRAAEELGLDSFSYTPIGTLDLSRRVPKFENPEKYFIQPTDDCQLREVRENSSTFHLPDGIDAVLLYDIGAESGVTILSSLNYKSLYREGTLVVPSVGQDSTGHVPYAGVRSEEQPVYKGLPQALKPINLIRELKRHGYFDLVVTNPNYSRLNPPKEREPVATW